MPRRDDLETILIVGSGPIVIGQACEFDYSGTQACKVLQSEGYRVVLVNSNPATIMTDPEFAAATYVEPLDAPSLTRVIERERPDALLPTLGGQTALNLAVELHDAGVLDRFGVELIGASVDAIRVAENRHEFKAAMEEIGLAVPESGFATTLGDAMEIAEQVGYPLIVRPSFILGGGGTGVAHSADEMRDIAERGLAASPVTEILIEQSVVGWKEFELEVMRDHADNVVVVCSIENVDPIGVHTGDSITVAPAQTLTDVEYQRMRDAAFACIRRIGVDTGGSNIQFAVNPADGRQQIIEMNPRVSRSSALASKATGFPIAKIAAKLAVGYRLDEIQNDITRETPASFEPTIDYVVTKIPRWAFEKLPGSNPVLGTQMQSVGEVMAIGRTFCESLQKAVRSLETGRRGLNCDPAERELDALSDDELAPLAKPAVIILGSGPNRIGQGVEFDYCCVHAAFALRDAGYETVMVNCNPETVSTDYDTSDRLFFEPLTTEDVLNVCERLQEAGDVRGVIVSLGGQTPLKLAHDLERSAIPVLGTSPASIDAAEDREQFNALCDRLGIPQPEGAMATSADEAVAVANTIGYPVLVRPSYVLGGRAMQIVYDDTDIRRAMAELEHSGSLGLEGGPSAERP